MTCLQSDQQQHQAFTIWSVQKHSQQSCRPRISQESGSFTSSTICRSRADFCHICNVQGHTWLTTEQQLTTVTYTVMARITTAISGTHTRQKLDAITCLNQQCSTAHQLDTIHSLLLSSERECQQLQACKRFAAPPGYHKAHALQPQQTVRNGIFCANLNMMNHPIVCNNRDRNLNA